MLDCFSSLTHYLSLIIQKYHIKYMQHNEKPKMTNSTEDRRKFKLRNNVRIFKYLIIPLLNEDLVLLKPRNPCSLLLFIVSKGYSTPKAWPANHQAPISSSFVGTTMFCFTISSHKLPLSFINFADVNLSHKWWYWLGRRSRTYAWIGKTVWGWE